MSGWRYVEVRTSTDHILYTDQTFEELRELIDTYTFDDYIDRFCDCGGEHKFDVDENPDRWTKSRYFPTCRVQVGGMRHSLRDGWDLEHGEAAA